MSTLAGTEPAARKRGQITDRAADGEPGWTVVLVFQDGRTSREGCWAYRYTPEYLVLNQYEGDTVIYPVPGSIREVHIYRNGKADDAES